MIMQKSLFAALALIVLAAAVSADRGHKGGHGGKDHEEHDNDHGLRQPSNDSCPGLYPGHFGDDDDDGEEGFEHHGHGHDSGINNMCPNVNGTATFRGRLSVAELNSNIFPQLGAFIKSVSRKMGDQGKLALPVNPTTDPDVNVFFGKFKNFNLITMEFGRQYNCNITEATFRITQNRCQVDAAVPFTTTTIAPTTVAARKGRDLQGKEPPRGAGLNDLSTCNAKYDPIRKNPNTFTSTDLQSAYVAYMSCLQQSAETFATQIGSTNASGKNATEIYKTLQGLRMAPVIPDSETYLRPALQLLRARAAKARPTTPAPTKKSG